MADERVTVSAEFFAELYAIKRRFDIKQGQLHHDGTDMGLETGCDGQSDELDDAKRAYDELRGDLLAAERELDELKAELSAASRCIDDVAKNATFVRAGENPDERVSRIKEVVHAYRAAKKTR